MFWHLFDWAKHDENSDKAVFGKQGFGMWFRFLKVASLVFTICKNSKTKVNLAYFSKQKQPTVFYYRLVLSKPLAGPVYSRNMAQSRQWNEPPKPHDLITHGSLLVQKTRRIVFHFFSRAVHPNLKKEKTLCDFYYSCEIYIFWLHMNHLKAI